MELCLVQTGVFHVIVQVTVVQLYLGYLPLGSFRYVDPVLQQLPCCRVFDFNNHLFKP
ncbi:MAG: hypothetical protein ABW148_05765 [Sedimenticola sp.]